jgi:hypothetical protein
MPEPLVILFALAGATWLATVALAAFSGGRARADEDPSAAVAHATRHARISRFVGVPAALLVLGVGLQLVAKSDLSSANEWWVGTAMGTWIVAFSGSTMLRSTMLNRAARVATVEGPDAEDARWRIRQVDMTVRGELLLLVVAAIVLVLQPA